MENKHNLTNASLIAIIILLVALIFNVYYNTKSLKENSYFQEQMIIEFENVNAYVGELGAQGVRTTANSLAKGIKIADPMKIEAMKKACFRDTTYDIAPEACDCVISTDGTGDLTEECKIFEAKSKDEK